MLKINLINIKKKNIVFIIIIVITLICFNKISLHSSNLKLIVKDINKIEIINESNNKKININNQDEINFFIDKIKYKLNFKEYKNYNYKNNGYIFIFKNNNSVINIIKYDYNNKVLLAPLTSKLDKSSYKIYDNIIEKYIIKIKK